MKLVAAVLALAFALTGCAPARGPALDPSRVEAIQTRPIDAPPEAAFRAAAGVMLDRGMVITMSDYSAGLLAGAMWGGAGPQAHPHMIPAERGMGEVVVWVRAGGRGTIMRVQPVRGIVPIDDADLVSRIAAQVSERTLMAAAPRKSP